MRTRSPQSRAVFEHLSVPTAFSLLAAAWSSSGRGAGSGRCRRRDKIGRAPPPTGPLGLPLLLNLLPALPQADSEGRVRDALGVPQVGRQGRLVLAPLVDAYERHQLVHEARVAQRRRVLELSVEVDALFLELEELLELLARAGRWRPRRRGRDVQVGHRGEGEVVY